MLIKHQSADTVFAIQVFLFMSLPSSLLLTSCAVEKIASNGRFLIIFCFYIMPYLNDVVT